MLRYMLVMLLLQTATLAGASEASPRWISGSWVNIRSAPQRDAPVLERLIINHPVLLQQQDGEFCSISWGDKQHGYVACKLLSDQPLTLANVERERLPDGTANPDYSVRRAFWLEPTLMRFLATGHYLEQIMLPQKQRDLEAAYIQAGNFSNPPEIRRFPVPEFEAMKAKLAAGVVAPPAQWHRPSRWDELQAYLQRNATTDPDINDALAAELPGLGANYRLMYAQISLPATQASFFARLEDIGRPKARPEELSAQFGLRWQLTTFGKPQWSGSSNNGPALAGIWDVGGFEARLEQPVFAVTTAGNALAVATTKAAFRNDFTDQNVDCPAGQHIDWPKQGQLPGYGIPRQARTLLHLARAPKPAQIKSSSTDIILLRQRKAETEEVFQRAKSTSIDLDRDGWSDIVLWDTSALKSGVLETRPYHLLMIFVNVGGGWYLLDKDEEDPPCGC